MKIPLTDPPLYGWPTSPKPTSVLTLCSDRLLGYVARHVSTIQGTTAEMPFSVRFENPEYMLLDLDLHTARGNRIASLSQKSGTLHSRLDEAISAAESLKIPTVVWLNRESTDAVPQELLNRAVLVFSGHSLSGPKLPGLGGPVSQFEKTRPDTTTGLLIEDNASGDFNAISPDLKILAATDPLSQPRTGIELARRLAFGQDPLSQKAHRFELVAVPTSHLTPMVATRVIDLAFASVPVLLFGEPLLDSMGISAAYQDAGLPIFESLDDICKLTDLQRSDVHEKTSLFAFILALHGRTTGASIRKIEHELGLDGQSLRLPENQELNLPPLRRTISRQAQRAVEMSNSSDSCWSSADLEYVHAWLETNSSIDKTRLPSSTDSLRAVAAYLA